MRRLKIGAYEIDGRLLFERKTLRNLTLSIVDGRLFSEMKRMVHSPERAVLVLEVYHSNRLEVLIERLTEVTGVPLSDPFRPEMIVVQNQGMARWVAQQMA